MQHLVSLGLLVLLTAACSDPAPGGPDANPAPDAAVGTTSLRSGSWNGTAQVAGGTFLIAGEHPARLSAYVDRGVLRGILDVEQTPLGTLDSPSYYLEGEVTEAGAVTLRLSERACGAADPIGLCYPEAGRRLVYQAQGQVEGQTVVFEAATVVPGSTPHAYAFEPPFTALTLQLPAPPAPASGLGLAGTWSGSCRVPRDVIYPLPTPFVGTNSLRIVETAGSVGLEHFENEGVVFWPDQPDVLLGETFRADAATNTFWFVEVWLIDTRWLYMGKQVGDTLQITVVGDPFSAAAVWGDTRVPADPLTAPLLTVEGVCWFERA